jgi:hypothetical protein
MLLASAAAHADQPDNMMQPFQFKLSGFQNLVTGGDVASPGSGGVGLSESELEATPQYHTASGTIFALRSAFNLQAFTSRSNSAWQLAVPETSLFGIGSFGRIEIGQRSGFPQSLVGFTPSQIAFTAAEFGPDSGLRLDPDGRLPTTFLPSGLAARINDLTYLGYAARFYDDESAKLIYVTPRSRSGLYGAISFAPHTEHPGGFRITGSDQPSGSDAANALSDPQSFRDIVQAAAVWNYRSEKLDLSSGLTYSHAQGAGIDQPVAALRHSDSLSAGVSATFYDTWTLGLSGTYDGFSAYRNNTNGSSPATTPYGVVASLNYVNGPWIAGGYYQHANAESRTLEAGRDTVDIGELGVSYLVGKNHDLLGDRFYTDVRLFASAYYYRFHGSEPPQGGGAAHGAVLMVGGRFSFF